ncbi:MAG: hypothetical protein AB1597_04620 [Chloroflexota bacterium]
MLDNELTMTYFNLDQITSGFETRAKQIGGVNAWIFKAKTSISHPVISSIMTRLDNIVTDMPVADREWLIRRFTMIIPENADSFKNEYNDKFLDALVEILGWGWLSEKHKQAVISFNQTTDQPTPDLIARGHAGNLIAAMECKSIHTSNDFRKYIRRCCVKTEAREVNTRFLDDDPAKNPLLSKVLKTLEEAEKQLSGTPAPLKYVLMDFSFDISSALRRPRQLSLIDIAKKKAEERGIILIPLINFEVCNPQTM